MPGEGCIQPPASLKTEAGLWPSDAASEPGQRVASRPNAHTGVEL